MKVINKQQLKKKKLGPKKSQFMMVEKEIAIMKNMGHPYVVKLIEVIDDPNHNKQFLI
jgi:serine/threonine protein kinase